MRNSRVLLATTTLTLGACATGSGPSERSPRPPPTEVRVAEDTHHGVAVTDPYRWLEDGADPAVKSWSRAQTEHARAYLDARCGAGSASPLPGRDGLARRLREILDAQLISHGQIQLAGGRVFAMKLQPPKPQRLLVVLPRLDAPDQAEVILDPATLDPSGTTTIDWYRASPDGKHVAVSISTGGSESGDVVVYDVATRARVFETVPRVNGGTAGGDLSWAPDGKSFL